MKKKWPIDRIRSEALPRLVPHRRPGALHLVALVSLKDCTPFLGTWPPDFDEVVAVVTRLLLVPGGPLVLEDGQTTRLRRLARRRNVFSCDRIWMSGLYLVCYDGDLVSEPADVPQPISRAHVGYGFRYHPARPIKLLPVALAVAALPAVKVRPAFRTLPHFLFHPLLLTSIGTDYVPSFAKKTGVGSSILSSSIITDISLLSNTPLANFRLNVFGVMPKALAIAVLEYDFSAINPASLSVLIILTPFSLVAFYVPSIAHIMVHVKYLFGLIPTFLLHIAQSVNGSGGR